MEVKPVGQPIGGKQKTPMTTEEKLEVAVKLKEEGNNLFRQGEYRKANSKYVKIFLYTKGLPGRSNSNPGEAMLAASGALGDSGNDMSATSKMNPDLERSIVDLEATAHANSAQCHLKLGNAEKTIDCAQNALRLNPKAWKAHWREASARSDLLKDYEGAVKCLDKALNIVGDGDSKTDLMKFKAKIVTLAKKEDVAALKKQRASYKSVFDKLAAEDQEPEA